MPRVRIAPPRAPGAPPRQQQPAGWPPAPRTIKIAARRQRRSRSSRPVRLRCGAPACPTARAPTPTTTRAAASSPRPARPASRCGRSSSRAAVETPARHVLAVLDVKRGDADPWLRSGAGAGRELERLGLGQEASVERRLPDTILVRIVERRPLALWQHSARLSLIDRDGREIRTPIRRNSPSCRWWSATMRRNTPPSCWPCWRPSPSWSSASPPRSASAAGAGTCAWTPATASLDVQLPETECRRGLVATRRDRARPTSCSTATSPSSICACPTAWSSARCARPRPRRQRAAAAIPASRHEHGVHRVKKNKKKPRNGLVAALDVGSTKIACFVAQGRGRHRAGRRHRPPGLAPACAAARSSTWKAPRARS